MSAPASAATGTLNMKAAATRSLAIITRRASRLSTQAPAGSPMTSHGSQAHAVRMPIQPGSGAESDHGDERQQHGGGGVAEQADALAEPERG